MDILKEREKSKLLHHLQLLDKRMDLPIDQKRYLYNLEKGLEGERSFDALVKTQINGECIVLNDLLLVINGTTIQIDTLMITAEGVRIYEVKNYKGNYKIQSGRLLTLSGQEVLNPLAQLDRSLIKLKQLFHTLNVEINLMGQAVFVNPSFFLYNADINDAFIYSGQLINHLSEISKKMTHISKEHHLLAEKLMKMHTTEAAYEKELPAYDFPSLKKNVFCVACGSPDIKLTQRSSQCRQCLTKTTIEKICLKNIGDLKVLFPDKTLTTAVASEWCGERIGSKRMRHILKNNFKQKGRTSATYYD
ncbi:nuclease-related domain-containing protein [Alkalibacterium putridalgicola]|uniref:nuclease-related domain-containing protein n=1 Tax=Alkalibacterium putridalgicola TaxID=426703 RepID=UPI0034CEB350